MTFYRSLLALAAAAAFAPAHAATSYDFQTVAGADAGTFVGCTGSDQCAKTNGGTMTFFSGAVGATGYYQTRNAVSMLDNFSDRPTNRPELKWVGLGVYHTSGPSSSDDNITKDERLVLSFANEVVLTDVFLRAEGHYASFATGAQFGVQSDAGVVGFNFTNGTNQYNIASAGLGASKTWTFYGYSNDAKEQYYVSSVTAVPEPEAYVMLLAGLGTVGFIGRRRKLKQPA